jgi:hypothetical protein
MFLLLLFVFCSAVVENLNSLDAINGSDALVAFVVAWCPHCVRLKAELLSLAASLAELNVRVATLDCEAMKDTCVQQGAHGYPTLKLFRADRSSVDCKLRDRSAASLLQFVRRFVGGVRFDTIADADQLASFTATNRVALLGVVAPLSERRSGLEALLGGVATRLAADDDVSVGVALMLDAAHDASLAHVALLRTFDEPRKYYDGSADDVDALYRWIRAHRKPLLDKHRKGVYSNSEPLVFLHRDVSAGAARDDEVVAAVRAASLELQYEPLSFAWLDKSQWDGVRAGLSGRRYPALTIDDLRFVNRRYAYDERKAITTADVVAWVRQLLAGTLAHTNFSQPLSLAAGNEQAPVKTLVLDNFDELVERRTTALFVLFHSPTCGTCQKVYAPFARLAESFAGDARVRFLRGESWMNDFPEWLQLSGVPDLRFFGAASGRVTREFAGNDRSFEAMRAWLDAQLLKAGGQPKAHDEL